MQFRILSAIAVGVALFTIACSKDEPGPDPLRDQYEFAIIAADTTEWEAQVLRMDGSVISTVSAFGQKNFYTERTHNRMAILKIRILNDSSATSIRTGYRDLKDIFDGKSNTIQLDPALSEPYDLPNDTIDFANL